MEQERTGLGPATCPDCHALVSDLAAHERWHSRVVADIAIAVRQEIARSSTAG